MKKLGTLLIILGVATMILGGLGLAIWSIYDLVVNWDSLSRIDIFWNIVWLILRDIFAIGSGIILFVVGGAMVSK